MEQVVLKDWKALVVEEASKVVSVYAVQAATEHEALEKVNQSLAKTSYILMGISEVVWSDKLQDYRPVKKGWLARMRSKATQ